nr:ABCC10 protein [Diaphanosoma celebensis]
MDWQLLCGTPNLTIWSEDRDLGTCFSQLALDLPASVLLTAVSSYYIGKEYNFVIRGWGQWTVLFIRTLVCLAMAVIPLVNLLILCYHNQNIYLMDFITAFIDSFSWLSHSLYVIILQQRVSRSLRGPLPALIAWILTVVPCVICLRKQIYIHSLESAIEAEFVSAVTTASLQLLYLITLVPHGMASSTNFDNIFRSLAEENVNRRLSSNFSRFSIDTDPFYLGVAMEGVAFLPKLFLSWIRPLMVKGIRGQLNSSEDVFDMPASSSTNRIATQFARAVHESKSIPLSLHRCFGVPYYLLGFFKFLADLLSFAGPLLLNVLVQFIDDSTEPMLFGYLCAGALCLANFFSALCNVHFNFGVAEMGLRLRAALSTLVYSKTLSVSSADGSHVIEFVAASLRAKWSNLMSTDIDRVVNFCPSFHAFWSLPVQVAVTLYFLHSQVGLAFLAGVGFAVLLVPVNRIIAVRIGRLSGRMMAAKDRRVQLINELLTGIRVIKYYAWERHFRHKIEGLREEELKALKGLKYLDALCVYFWATTPVLVAILTFSTYVFMGGELTAAKVFTCMALFNMLMTPLNAFPWVLSGLVEAFISLRRVRRLIELPDMDLNAYYSPSDEETVLAIRAGHFTWRDGAFELKDLNFSVRKGQFVGIVGQVGSGKTTLLHAIVGELIKLGGQISLKNAEQGVSMVTQEPWIQHGTIRDNILFGRPYNATKYRDVLEVCALNADLRLLSEGDQTHVGDNGVTLSGGQRARIALARAVYQDRDIYLMDDVLAAVDPQVAKQLVDGLLNGYLKNKTRILCTHQPLLLQPADWVLILQDGKIVKQGPPSEVLFQDSDLDSTDGTAEQIDSAKESADEDQRERAIGLEEERCHGSVQLGVYASYCKAMGLYVAPAILAALICMQTTRNVSDWWLAYWVTSNTTAAALPESTPSLFRSFLLLYASDVEPPVKDDRLSYYLGIYGAIAALNTLFTFLRAFFFAYGGLQAARSIHKQLVDVILQAKISFFDCTPLGRILNRFSSDTHAVDDALPFILNILLAQVFGTLGTIIVTCVGIPWILLLLLPLGFIYFNLQNYYRHTSRELKRLATVTLSPIYSHFAETLGGLVTLRATRSSERFIQENRDRVEENIKTQFAGQAAAQWLNLRLQLIGVAVVTGVGIFAVLQHHLHTVDPGLVGLAISYALSITSVLSGVVTSFVDTEKELVSVERVLNYVDRIQVESDAGVRVVPPPTWPSRGVITFRNVSMKYRDHYPLALRNVSFETRPAEKIGIVGRTGSGKSSLFQVLFRLVDACSGDVLIDDISLRDVELERLRSRIAIIPQVPFIFSGSVRDNLDPTGRFTDHQLWKALGRCHLSESVSQWGGLETNVLERGSLLSAGQKQLLCLARALLLNSQVICIDEATASVDLETDRLIQQTIRVAFRSSTVLTIAHRMNTTLNCDRILVMNGGQVAEWDAPSKLLENPSSQFSKLVACFK